MPIVVGTDTYISVAYADAYMALSLNALAWTSANNDMKEQALVTATRMMDRQRWVGEKTDPLQTLDWPRTNVTDEDGQPVDDSIIPLFVAQATAELALALLSDPALLTNYSQDSNIEFLKAGSVEIKFFKPLVNGRFPAIIQELIGFYLFGRSRMLLPFASGTCEESQLFQYPLGWPYR